MKKIPHKDATSINFYTDCMGVNKMIVFFNDNTMEVYYGDC